MLGNEKLWSCPPTGADPLPNGVQIWAAWLNAGDDDATGSWSILSSTERDRANRFASHRDRARFLAARGLLRTILGSCLGVQPQRLVFGYSARGKPLLGGTFASCGLEFNVAHSGDLAVFAVAQHGVVGVDVEQIRPVPELSTLIERCLSARECAEIKRLSGEQAARVFFKIWTRKESWLKATGEGISGLPGSIEAFGPPGEESLSSGPQVSPSEARLCLYDLAPAPGFLGALAATPQ
jgi:4'-phosphopantetheinyl transferase